MSRIVSNVSAIRKFLTCYKKKISRKSFTKRKLCVFFVVTSRGKNLKYCYFFFPNFEEKKKENNFKIRSNFK